MLIIEQFQTDKISHPRCTIKKAACKSFTIFTGKHLYWSVFRDKVEIKLQVVRPTTLLKRDSNTDVIL